MLLSDFFESLARRPGAALGDVIKPLADSLMDIRLGGDVQQTLVGLRILDYGFGFAFDREHHGPLGLLKLFHEVARAAAERGERLDVLGDVKHGCPCLDHSAFLGAHTAYSPGNFTLAISF